ncbi:hypothetical protein K443DRAFT_116166 [Laccaria amethystina LaAM-08-1]|uniref:HTH CENPB-type domain-containing protein n=1 Tax=Laccaria amethystina LaAM-08-1 TaxID=1095629 RepID=A0A0C9WZI5_9AGAR|nr:hypothetical protein K443DRAFT_116166 [Laccaria amethystina LaAM-08-1]
MAPKPLNILKKGLEKFSNSIKTRKDVLTSKLSRRESISSADERWLDFEANTVDEERILNDLERASDYERGLERLDADGKAIVKKLRELVGDLEQTEAYVCNFVLRKAEMTFPSEGSEHEKCTKEVPKPSQPAGAAPPVFTKKENTTLEQRIQILDWHHKHGKSQSATAKHFNPLYPNLQLKQPLISSWLKHKAEWHVQWAQVGRASDRSAKRVRQTEHPEISKMMDLWVSKAMNDKLLLTGQVLRHKWNTFADLLGIPEDDRLKLTDGWLTRFKARNGLKDIKRHGEAGSSAAETVTKERKRVQGLIEKYGYELRNIYNMDETGLFYGYALNFKHAVSSLLMLVTLG